MRDNTNRQEGGENGANFLYFTTIKLVNSEVNCDKLRHTL